MARTHSRARINRGDISKPLHEVDWKNHDDIVGFVQYLTDTRSERKGALEKQWLLNIAYFLGHQNLVWNEGQGSLWEPEAPPWRARLVCNMILPFVRKAIARWVRQEPTWTVVPATNEQEDQQVSRIADQVLQGYWRHCDTSYKLIDALTWMGVTGNGFLKALWDSQQGPLINVTAEDLIDKGEMTAESRGGLMKAAKRKWEEMVGRKAEPGESQDLHLGDLDIEAVSPFEIDVALGARAVRDCLWLMHTKIRDPDYIYQRYGKEIKPDTNEGQAAYYQRRIETMVSPQSSSGARDDQEGTMVHELWVRPIRHWPKGIRVVVGGGEVLEEPRPNPYQHGHMPFAHLKEIHVSGRFWADSVVQNLRPLQEDYNRARSQVKENRDQMSKPKWKVNRAAKIAGTAITSEPGEIIFYSGPFAPEPVVPPPIPHYVTQTMEFDQRDMQDIAFSHDVSMGKNPPGARSGEMIRHLREADEHDLTPTGQLIDRAVEQLGSMVLQTLHQYVNEQRLIKIVGANNALDTLWFKGSDLVGPQANQPNVSYFDVRVQSYSKLPQSRTAVFEFVDKLIERGVLHPQQHRDKILRALGMGDTDQFVDETRMDRSRQLWENEQLLKGVPIQPERYENHDVHMETINEFRRSTEFLKTEPEIRQVFEQHHVAHELLAAGEAARKQVLLKQAMLQQQAIASGAVDQPTIPPQPTGEPQPV